MGDVRCVNPELCLSVLLKQQNALGSASSSHTPKFGGEDSLHWRAAVGFFLGQVKNSNLAATLTKDNADVYSPWKP